MVNLPNGLRAISIDGEPGMELHLNAQLHNHCCAEYSGGPSPLLTSNPAEESPPAWMGINFQIRHGSEFMFMCSQSLTCMMRATFSRLSTHWAFPVTYNLPSCHPYLTPTRTDRALCSTSPKIFCHTPNEAQRSNKGAWTRRRPTEHNQTL